MVRLNFESINLQSPSVQKDYVNDKISFNESGSVRTVNAEPSMYGCSFVTTQTTACQFCSVEK